MFLPSLLKLAPLSVKSSLPICMRKTRSWGRMTAILPFLALAWASSLTIPGVLRPPFVGGVDVSDMFLLLVHIQVRQAP